MSRRRTQTLPLELYRKIEGPDLLKVLGEARRKLTSTSIPLGLSAEGFASLVNVQSGRTVRKWEAGDRDIPGPVLVITKALMESRAVRQYFGLSLPGDSTSKSE